MTALRRITLTVAGAAILSAALSAALIGIGVRAWKLEGVRMRDEEARLHADPAAKEQLRTLTD